MTVWRTTNRLHNALKNCPSIAALLISLLLFACAGADPETTSTVRTVPAETAFALPPPGGPAIVTISERRYSNAIQQDIALSTSSRTIGQNLLRISLFGPVNFRLAPQATLSDSSLAGTNISHEMRDQLPGVRMTISPYYVQNQYGPFGYAVGRALSGDLCLYAWQRIRPARSTLIRNRGTISLRLRVCDKRASEEQLLAIVYGLTINAFFSDIQWNPYGDPPGMPASLGRTGSPVYPTSESGVVTLYGRAIAQPARQPVSAPT
ncbi:MAG: cellulose biosynthesis protein BcsN, partial [Tardiphaga sp.]